MKANTLGNIWETSLEQRGNPSLYHGAFQSLLHCTKVHNKYELNNANQCSDLNEVLRLCPPVVQHCHCFCKQCRCFSASPVVPVGKTFCPHVFTPTLSCLLKPVVNSFVFVFIYALTMCAHRAIGSQETDKYEAWGKSQLFLVCCQPCPGVPDGHNLGQGKQSQKFVNSLHPLTFLFLLLLLLSFTFCFVLSWIFCKEERSPLMFIT